MSYSVSYEIGRAITIIKALKTDPHDLSVLRAADSWLAKNDTLELEVGIDFDTDSPNDH